MGIYYSEDEVQKILFWELKTENILTFSLDKVRMQPPLAYYKAPYAENCEHIPDTHPGPSERTMLRDTN